VHHDLWDYEVPAQPALYDVRWPQRHNPGHLIQVTKRGQIFMLDRRTGAPIAEVEEQAVAQGVVADDHLSPTQPCSAGMPTLGAERFTESHVGRHAARPTGLPDRVPQRALRGRFHFRRERRPPLNIQAGSASELGIGLGRRKPRLHDRQRHPRSCHEPID
jgi:hypothetical protein